LVFERGGFASAHAIQNGMTVFEQTHPRLHQNQFLKLSEHLKMKGKEE
jgi:glycerol dehydrogenase-like iron-containing ADH family enzyme